MERWLTIVAMVIGASVALLLPLVHFLAGYQSLQAVVTTEVEINARLVTQIVNVNPELWMVEGDRLAALVDRGPVDRTPEIRVVFGAGGEVVAEKRDALAPPFWSAESDVFDAGQVTGKMRITRSLRPLLVETAWVGLFSLVLGLGIVFALKWLPLRALVEANRKLRLLASYDSLTGLPNRELFRDRLAQSMARAQRNRRRMALMLLDLDHFKDVNDSLGHAFGDRLLTHVAQVIEESLRTTDTLAFRAQEETSTSRLGGDEFTIILENIVDAGSAAVVAERILRALEQPFQHDGHEVHVSASIGITLYPHDDVDIDQLIRHADAAMYKSKEQGRNVYTFYSGDLNTALAERMALLNDLHHALTEKQFVLYYQPQARLVGGEIVGVEALIRWNHPTRGLVPPDRFIPMLEETGMIVAVGEWVIEEACAALGRWDALGLPPLTMAVNLSGRQFRSPSLLEVIGRSLLTNNLLAHRLELELTESLLVEDNELSRKLLASFKAMGLPVAIDDFGTGQSSLSYLKRFNIDVLKIDRSFVRDLPNDADDCAIADAIIALAHSLRLRVVAEGIETREQAEFLRQSGCELMQGYLLSRPIPEREFTDWMTRYLASGESSI